ncbi:MAG: PspC domain-containing protein [Flavobacteriaceae bacterium]|nr:PspC domain-containing protein [Flavobacteriaceae bacterium]
MNKTININLGGIFFHIDESAYLKLKRYLDAVRVSLSDDPKGQEEILTDIEARIGELLSQKIKDARQVINENDINEIVEIMGKPEDYVVDEEDTVYPGAGYTERKSKKLYRDGDDKFLGGVSSGMAHYFNVDVIWVRLAWLIAAFGFGFGFLVYPILWILLPQANTTAEKLEMMGEPVTIANIEKKIKEELGDTTERIKNGFNEAGERIKNADYQKYGNKARSGMQEFIDVIGRIFSAIFTVIGKFIGVVLIIISVGLIVALLISLFTVGSMDFFHEGWFFQQNMLYNSSGLPLWVISLLIFILIAIPLFFLFLLGLRILSGDAKTLGKTGKLSLIGIWLIALLTSIFFGTKQFMQTAFDGVIYNEKELFVSAKDTLTIKFVGKEGYGDTDDYSNPWDYTVITDQAGKERIYSENTRLSIHFTDNAKAYIKVRKKSKGDSRESANLQAENIEYGFAIDSNSVALNTYFLT